MKIAVAAKGNTLESAVDPRFGRAGGFVVIDVESREFEFVENTQNVNAAQGAGIQAARTVAESGAGLVIVGHCGPKAFRTLTAAGIQVIVGFEGTVAEAVDRFEEGALAPAESADVEGHWT